MGKTLGVTFEVGARTMGTVASTFATVESRIKSLKASTKELQTFQTKAAALTTASARLQKTKADYAANPTAALKKELTAAQKAFNSAEKSAAKYNITVANSAKVQAQTTAAIKNTEAALARQEKLQANQAKRRELHGQITGTVAAAMTVAAPIKMAIDFESAFADVKKVVDFADTIAEKGAQKDIRALAADTGLAASGIAGIYAAAGEAKLATSREELKEFAQTAATMAVAFGTSAEDAGAKMASWRSKMGFDQKEVIELSDAINHLGNNMAAKSLDTAQVVERMGAVAKSAGLSAKSIAALSATFVASSSSPEVAATGMKNFLLTLTKGRAMTPKQQAAMQMLGFNDPKAVAEAMQKDAEGMLLSIMEKLSKVSKAEQGALLSTLFGTESIGAITPLLENVNLLKDAFGFVADEQSYAGSMAAEYAVRSATTEHSLHRLRRTVESLGISLGSVALPAITAVADRLGKMISPVITLSEKYPEVTTAVFGVISALAAFKVVGFAGAYAATILSDGLVMAKGAISLVTGAVRVMSAAMFANPIGLVVLAVAALGAGLYYLYQNCEPARNAMNKVWEVMKAVGRFMLPGLVIPLVAGWKIVSTVWKAGVVFMVAAWSAVKFAVAATWSAIKTAASWCCEAVKFIWGGLVGFFTSIWDMVKGPAIAVFEAIAAAAAWCVDFLRPVWEPVAGFFAGVWEAVKAPAVAVFDWINKKFDQIVEKFKWISDTWGKVNNWFGDDDQGVTVNTAGAQGGAAALAQTVASQSTVAPTETKTAPMPTVTAGPSPTPSFPGLQSKAEPVAVKLDSSSLPKFEMPAPQIQAPVSQEINVTMHGIPDKEFAQRVIDAVKSNSGAFEAIISKIVGNALANAKRVAYDG